MVAIIGVDGEGAYRPAARLYSRLFPGSQAVMVHAVNPTMLYAPIGMVPSFQTEVDYVSILEEAGHTTADRAAAEAREHGLNATPVLAIGSAAESLMREADARNAALIAVANTRKGAFGTLFSGSVSRGLATGSGKSLLVAKEGVRDEGPVRAVLATDHSAYANDAIDRFVQMRPSGIERIDVVTAFELNDYEASLVHLNFPQLGEKVQEWADDKLKEMGNDVVERLRAAGYTADCRVVYGHPNDAIRETMRETGAELLIVGAQGRGFIDRLFIGSVSLHQVVAEPYSVLVVRV
jgi:nucleotide-binding universal stress UspA family protein